MNYKDTLFLPETDFSMKASLPRNEPIILGRWMKEKLYKKLRNKLKKNKKFTLHDGPPYANGHLHMGHALNKILKDIIIRSKQMQGFDAAFVPGWDCHGLPIEWEVEQELRKKGDEKKNISIKEFRNKCRKFAEHWIKIQKKEFERFGVLGDWENYYSTMSYKVEAQIIREIGKFLLNGSLYKGSRPVMWSVVEKTALADAEIEYKDRLDNAIYVLFPIDKTNVKIEDKKNVNILIWTTTPWTIPGNRALAFNKSFSYSLLKENSSDTYFIVASDLVNKLKNDTGLKIKKIRDFNGKDLEKTICKHPLDDFGYKFKVPLLAADFVTKEEGTGIVHIAPGHGLDDFNLAKQNNIDVPKTIDESGIYYEDIPLLKGVHVFKADDKVIEFLEKSKKLLYKTDIFHSYPHSWRSKKPLIYRNTTQWFISLEKGNLREKAINALKDIDFFPKKGKNRITSMIEDRPDWCISRQRFWGVPLPIFINKKTNNPLIDRNVIENIARIFEKKGSDSWFELDPSEFLGNKYNKNDFIQVKDVIEVWFDSGSSHVYVLEDRKDLIWPADLYLEGSDQHRGWFHSSLLQSCGTRNKAPFKSILSHGFVVDGKGKKMSKSEGNVISPNEIINKYGADIIRLWTVASDYFEDIKIDENIIKSQIDSYRRIRNTLRFLIGNLKGFEDKEKTDYKNLPGLEKYILFRIWEIDTIIESSIKENNYHKIYKELLLFCSNDLSSFYFDIRKDCLYCDDKSNQKRKSCRSTLKIIFNFLTAWLAPILCFTTEEAWLSDNFNHKDSIHLRMFPKPDKKWADINFGEKWKEIINIRKVVTSAIEIKREKKIIGSSLEASVELSASNKMKDYINDMNLNDLFIVSSAKIVDKLSGDIFSLDGINDIKVSIKKAEGSKCERCWIISKEVNNNKNLCNRCNGVVNDNTKK